MNLITARARDTQILLATSLGTCKGSVPARQPSWKGWSDATRALSQHLHLSSVHHLRFTMWWIGIAHPIDRFYLLWSQHQTSRIWKPKSKTRSKTDPNDTKSCSSTHRWVTSNRIMNNKSTTPLGQGNDTRNCESKLWLFIVSSLESNLTCANYIRRPASLWVGDDYRWLLQVSRVKGFLNLVPFLDGMTILKTVSQCRMSFRFLDMTLTLHASKINREQSR